MKDKNVFFHIVTNKRLYKGQVIDFSKDAKNTLYNYFFNKAFTNDEGDDVNTILSNNISDNRIVLNTSDTKIVNGYLDNVSRSIRETITEMVRLKSHPHYPSRLSCLYVARNYNEVLKWQKIFESYNRNILQIVKVESDGPYFVGDASKLPTNKAIPFSDKIMQAEAYWDNTMYDELPEVLLAGRIKVVEIVEEF